MVNGLSCMSVRVKVLFKKTVLVGDVSTTCAVVIFRVK